MNGCPDRLEVEVAPEQNGSRLDKILASAAPDLSRGRVKALIEAGEVYRLTRTGRQTISEPRHRVNSGERYQLVRPDDQQVQHPKAESIDLEIVYEDGEVMVIDKPAGLVVHPGPGNPTGTLVNALIYHHPAIADTGAPDRPGIVHRLDKDTSGLLVVAKTQRAYESLVGQFSEHSIGRRYRALVKGQPQPNCGTISQPIGRHPRQRKKMAVVERGGKQAVTHYRVIKRFSVPDGPAFASLVEVELMTGRTHQVRVHMAHTGHPLIGDRIYGRTLRPRKGMPDELARMLAQMNRHALHATHLTFKHPQSGERLSFKSPLPPDFAALLTRLERDFDSGRL